jgi:limonene-1,2-epoxide hydrolase
MTASNPARVTAFCHSLADADMEKSCGWLAPEVLYHNTPWAPVRGHAAVREVLDPFVLGANCALRRMQIEHTAATDDVVMNVRLETWERAGIRVELSVAGLFRLRDGLIVEWRDY